MSQAQQQTGSPPPLSLLDVVVTVSGFLRRHFKTIYVFLLLGLLAGNVYMWKTAPTYTAAAQLILDMRNVQFAQQKSIVNDLALDSAFVESQVEVIKSKAVALAVISRLKLTERPEFVKSTGGLLGDVLQSAGRLVGLNEPLSEFELTERALATFSSRLTARRIGLSFVIEITYRAGDPDLAAQIANAVLSAYIDDQKSARTDTTRRAIEWLQESLAGLRAQALAADRAAVDFKTRNNIVASGGRLVQEQQIAELNSQTVVAASLKAEAKARLERIDAILAQPAHEASGVDGTVADTLRSEVITRLRTQYLDLSNREAEWSTRYGPNHAATMGLRDQMREIRNSIQAELRRIAETYRSDYQIAEQRETDMARQLAAAISQSGTTNSAQVTMRELEGTAQTYRTIYDEFMRRHMETLQQQSFPSTEGRVLSPAAKPLRVSWPRASVVYLLSLLVSFLAALAWALVSDLRRSLAANGQLPPPREGRLPEALAPAGPLAP